MKTAAILGASADPAKFGHKAVLAYALQGYPVWPVNPKESHIAGHPAYRATISVGIEPGSAVTMISCRECSTMPPLRRTPAASPVR